MAGQNAGSNPIPQAGPSERVRLAFFVAYGEKTCKICIFIANIQIKAKQNAKFHTKLGYLIQKCYIFAPQKQCIRTQDEK